MVGRGFLRLVGITFCLSCCSRVTLYLPLPSLFSSHPGLYCSQSCEEQLPRSCRAAYLG